MPYLTNIIQYFDATAKKFPTHPAVIDGDTVFTMEEVYNKTLCIAQAISTRIDKKINTVVAVYLPKDITIVVSNIGIMYSGNAYMNLDIKSPEQHTNKILENILPSLIITSHIYEKNFEQTDIPVLFIEYLEQEAHAAPVHCSKEHQDELCQIRSQVIDTDPLCVINTSGSTGIPKGVVLTHRGFIDFIEWSVNTGFIKEKEIVSTPSPVIFDQYSLEICLIMAKAATMLLIPDSISTFPARMVQLLQQHKVTFFMCVPTIMVNIANMQLLDNIDLPDLRVLWFAGEVFPTSKCNYWRKSLPHTTFVNLYGPNEVTIICTYHVLTREFQDSEPIPIGIPCHNTSIVLLNDENKEAAPDEDAELCVRGSGLAIGYYNDPEKTAAVFMQNPCNTKYIDPIYRTGDIVYVNNYGEFVYKGRKDTLIKHQGCRIELAELEHIIVNTIQVVENCAVLYNTSQKAITLFYEASDKMNEKQIRSTIANHIPRYMVPTVYVHYTELPRNANGKIDRLQLQISMNQS